MERLTNRQAQVLDLIKQHITDTGYPPTRADIAAELGFRSANASEEHLKALAKKGAIEIIPGTSRGIRLPEDSGLPVIGRVAAGNPLLAVENIEKHINVAASFFHPRADFLLRVRGDSMSEIGIVDGDLVAVHKSQEAATGQIVVARVNDEVTIKRFQRGRNRSKITLLPENKNHQPIEVDLSRDEFSIEGLYVGLMRQH